MSSLWTVFFSQAPFLLQLAAGEALFSLKYRRRSRFGLRCAAALAAEIVLYLLVCAMLLWVRSWLFGDVLFYLLLFLVSLLGIWMCFQESVWSVVLCGISGYLCQHLGAQIILILWGGDGLTFIFQGPSLDVLYFRITETLIYAAIYLLIYLLFARKANAINISDRVERSVFYLSAVTLVLIIVLSSIRDHYASESGSLTVVTRLFSMVCCVFLLLLRSVILERSRMEREMETISQLRVKEREQYELSRENIEFINIKCHDLKHQIEVFERRGSALTAEELGEIKDAIAIYDTTVKTGNETLDTLLTERSVYCKKHGIRLTCIADGDQLSFLSVGDICSLFGNALDNAIEAVSKLEREEERVISLIVRTRLEMLSIAVDNYFSSPLTFENGLPLTTKEDRRVHGFGLKSMQLLVERYGGEMSVFAEGDMFHLAILFPLQA